VQHGATSRVIESTSYKEIGTGFYVVPRLSGERVLLDISPQKEQLVSGRDKSIATQRIVTTVSGRLGEWIELGGISQRNEGGETGWAHGTGQTSNDSQQVWVRVEALP
jgi:type II secretory pathway component GspD/PulD (secretin)